MPKAVNEVTHAGLRSEKRLRATAVIRMTAFTQDLFFLVDFDELTGTGRNDSANAFRLRGCTYTVLVPCPIKPKDPNPTFYPVGHQVTILQPDERAL
jgi:hypothetical protein